MQLYIPLNFLGTSYRVIIQSLVNVEDMFILFDEDPEIQDSPDAGKLQVWISQKLTSSLSSFCQIVSYSTYVLSLSFY